MPETKPRRDDEILRIGRLMSNVCFNIESVVNADKEVIQGVHKLRRDWDAAVLKYRNSFKKRKRKRNAD